MISIRWRLQEHYLRWGCGCVGPDIEGLRWLAPESGRFPSVLDKRIWQEHYLRGPCGCVGPDIEGLRWLAPESGQFPSVLDKTDLARTLPELGVWVCWAG